MNINSKKHTCLRPTRYALHATRSTLRAPRYALRVLRYAFCAFLVSLMLSTSPVLAQADGLTLSITPPLVNVNVNPGQLWKSQVKLVNNNSQPIKIYVQVRDFKSRSDNGSVEFLDIDPEALDVDSHFLSHWIDLLQKEVEIEAYSSREIEFVVIVPESAGPGGYYAAILAGTTPPDNEEDGSVIKVSSLLASLILLNVSGDVVEKGDIREFSTDQDFYSRPEAKFTVRFENQGNTHVLPRGDIRITAPFSRDRETISINHGKDTGNVLPGEIRRWDFDWKGQGEIWQMGRYRADLTLVFGDSGGRQTVSYTLFFWVIYWQYLLVFSGLLGLLIISIVLFVKVSIKRSIKKMQQGAGIVRPAAPMPMVRKKRPPIKKRFKV